jgi:hypothetical protein
MKKLRFFFRTYEQHIKGYALMYPPTEQEMLEAILVKLQQIGGKYIRHFAQQEFIQDDSLPQYKVSDLSIPRGQLDYYITVYYND